MLCGQVGRWPCWLSWKPWCVEAGFLQPALVLAHRERHLCNGDDLIQRLACERKYVCRNLPPRGRLRLPDTPVERLRLVPENIARLPSGAGEPHSEGICFVERRRRHRQTNDDAGPPHFAGGLRITVDPDHVAPVGSP